MQKKNEYLATRPFDLYDLTLFELVAATGSFTRAGASAGLTQSAITRRIAGMEGKLGLRLFERTTRCVALTGAGEDLRARVAPLVAQTRQIVADFSSGQGLRPPELRVGVARSIGLAYLPGFFFAFQRAYPHVLLDIRQENSAEILRALDAGELDAGLLCPPRALPRSLVATHRFPDEFTLIVPPKSPLAAAWPARRPVWANDESPSVPPLVSQARNPVAEGPRQSRPLKIDEARDLLKSERWLLIDEHGHTGRGLRRWLTAHEWPIVPAMSLDSFDMIANLVSLGLGVSLVPHRTLPLYERRRAVLRLPLREKFTRELAVVVRKERKRSEVLEGLVRKVLF